MLGLVCGWHGLSVATPAFAESSWRVGVLADDLPFSRVALSTTTATGSTVQGLYVDWWRELGRTAGRGITFLPCADNLDCIERLKRSDVDFVGPAPFYDDLGLRFTRPVNRRYVVAVSLARSPIDDARALAGRRVGIVTDVGDELSAIRSWQPSSAAIVPSRDAPTWLASGKVDVVVTNRSLGGRSRENLARRRLWFRWQHVYARAEHAASLDRLDRAIDRLQPSSARIAGAERSVGADELLLDAGARPVVDRAQLAFIADHPTIRLGASHWEPLAVQTGGRFDGLALRIVRHHLQRAGLTPIFEGEDDWPKVKRDAQRGVYDGLGFILFRPPSQIEPLIFTRAMIDLPMVAVARSDAEFWASADDVVGQRLVGHPQYGEVNALLSRNADVTFIPEVDAGAALERVRSGRADAWLEYLPIARAAISAVGATDVKLAFRLGGPRGAVTALQPAWAPVVPLIDRSIRNTSDEELRRITASWALRRPPPPRGRWFTGALIAVTVVLGLGIVWLARRLGREHRTVRQRERALRRAQLLSGIGSVELRPPYERVYLDGETARLLGVDPTTEVQSLEDHLRLFAAPERVRATLDAAKTSSASVRIDVEVNGEPPQVFTYELAPPQTVDGQRGVMTGTVRNVTSERAREAHKKELEQQVLHLQKQDAIGRLAGGIAHDFNNMLAASIGYTELALLDLASDHPARKSMEQVLNASAKSRDLVRQLLTFSRCTSQSYEVLRLDRCVVEALSLVRASVPSTVTLDVVVSPSPVWVRGDHTQLTQVVVNLVNNAVDAMNEEGTVTVTLDVGAEPPAWLRAFAAGDRFARLAVSDSGPGIDPAIQHQIFDPFFTTKPRGKGTGLGLSIVHGVVRAHQGHIDTKAGAMGGARFDVVLPVVDAPTAAARRRDDIETGIGQSILVVDDEPALANVCRAILERHGYRVTAVTESPRARALLEDPGSTFDLLLTDLTMPQLSGVQLAEQSRRLRPTLPILLLTGYRADVPPSSEDLFFEVLPKPLSRDDLLAAVGRALRRGAGGVQASPSSDDISSFTTT